MIKSQFITNVSATNNRASNNMRPKLIQLKENYTNSVHLYLIINTVWFKSTVLPFFCLSHLSFAPPFQPSFGMTDKVGKQIREYYRLQRHYHPPWPKSLYRTTHPNAEHVLFNPHVIHTRPGHECMQGHKIGLNKFQMCIKGLYRRVRTATESGKVIMLRTELPYLLKVWLAHAWAILVAY